MAPDIMCLEVEKDPDSGRSYGALGGKRTRKESQSSQHLNVSPEAQPSALTFALLQSGCV